MAIIAISLLQRISLDMAASHVSVHLVLCLCMCVCAGLDIHLRSLFSLLTVLCYVYYISIHSKFSFSLDLWEGKVLCIRPSLAMGIHWGALAYIRWSIRLECARRGGGRQTCRHAAIHT